MPTIRLRFDKRRTEEMFWKQQAIDWVEARERIECSIHEWDLWDDTYVEFDFKHDVDAEDFENAVPSDYRG